MINYYYNDDLSLSEIAEITGITRQGARDSIKRAESALNEIEEKVGFFKYYSAKQEEFEKIKNLCDDISSLDDVEKIKSKIKDIEKITYNQ
jgi:predicted DNA-binding protein YlxM (UPF0122 family)